MTPLNHAKMMQKRQKMRSKSTAVLIKLKSWRFRRNSSILKKQILPKAKIESQGSLLGASRSLNRFLLRTQRGMIGTSL